MSQPTTKRARKERIPYSPEDGHAELPGLLRKEDRKAKQRHLKKKKEDLKRKAKEEDEEDALFLNAFHGELEKAEALGDGAPKDEAYAKAWKRAEKSLKRSRKHGVIMETVVADVSQAHQVEDLDDAGGKGRRGRRAENTRTPDFDVERDILGSDGSTTELEQDEPEVYEVSDSPIKVHFGADVLSPPLTRTTKPASRSAPAPSANSFMWPAQRQSYMEEFIRPPNGQRTTTPAAATTPAVPTPADEPIASVQLDRMIAAIEKLQSQQDSAMSVLRFLTDRGVEPSPAAASVTPMAITPSRVVGITERTLTPEDYPTSGPGAAIRAAAKAAQATASAALSAFSKPAAKSRATPTPSAVVTGAPPHMAATAAEAAQAARNNAALSRVSKPTTVTKAAAATTQEKTLDPPPAPLVNPFNATADGAEDAPRAFVEPPSTAPGASDASALDKVRKYYTCHVSCLVVSPPTLKHTNTYS